MAKKKNGAKQILARKRNRASYLQLTVASFAILTVVVSFVLVSKSSVPTKN